MAHEGEDESRKIQYPLDSNCYELLDEIGRGVSAIVYKAICIPMNSSIVAIKSIDLDRSKADFENVKQEAKTMSLLCHPNILKAHCSFIVNRRLWVVMPFMSAGSLQSIISSSFPDGLSEQCIAVILKETLCALKYLHDQGHLHRDIKAGNILIDFNGLIKLADFGVSASIYEPNPSHGLSRSLSSSALMLTDVAGTPYWMAPEVIHSHTGYSLKADIWSFGITALELAHGRPPLSHLPPSKSLIMKITKRFRFSDYETAKNYKNKKFSKAFKDLVGLCLDQDPSKRPSAEKLLKHSFFKNCKGSDFLVKNVVLGLNSVEQRFKEVKLQGLTLLNKSEQEGDEEDEGFMLGHNVKQRRISGWNFNEEGFELDPVFPTERRGEDEIVVKQVRFGEETIIGDKGGESGAAIESSLVKFGREKKVVCQENKGSVDVAAERIGGGAGGYGGGEAEVSGGVGDQTEISGGVGDEAEISGGDETEIGGSGGDRAEVSVGDQVEIGGGGDQAEVSGGVGVQAEISVGVGVQAEVSGGVGVQAEIGDCDQAKLGGGGDQTEVSGGGGGDQAEIGGGGEVVKEVMVDGMLFLKRSLDDQREKVMKMMVMLGGEEKVELSREEELMVMIEKLRIELENEKKKSSDLEMKVEFLKLQLYSAAS